MNVRIEDILKIRKGSSKTFVCDSFQGCHSAKSMVYYANKCRKPKNIERYRTSVDWENRTVVIKAE